MESCIGICLKDSGVKKIFIETETFGENGVDQVLSGSNYIRSTKGLFILSEALERLKFEDFFEYHQQSYENEFKILEQLRNAVAQQNFDDGIHFSDEFKKVSCNLINQFEEFLLIKDLKNDKYFITGIM